MRVEILSGQDEAKVYPLDKQKLFVGSGDICDIVVNDPNISRKHLMILCENDSYFIVDQGSTNGTYLNEERLIPGRRVEFTTFFPVRLGSETLVTLLSEAEEELPMQEEDESEEVLKKWMAPEKAQAEPKEVEPQVKTSPSPVQHEATVVLSLKDLKSSSTKSLVKRRSKIQEKSLKGKKNGALTEAKSHPKPKSKPLISLPNAAAILILGGAIVWNHLKKEEEKVIARIELDKAAEPPPPPPEIFTDAKFPSIEELQAKLTTGKTCTSDMETYLCDKLTVEDIANARDITSEEKSRSLIVVESGPNMLIFFDGTALYQRAQGLLMPPAEGSAEKLREYELSLWRIAASIFMLDAFGPGFDFVKYKETKFIFAFTRGTEVKAAALINAPTVQNMQILIKRNYLDKIPVHGMNLLKFTEAHFKVY